MCQRIAESSLMQRCSIAGSPVPSFEIWPTPTV